ncbi:MAG: Yip1 family protein [Syntrophorhabdaceae bacterium]|nr:YIP1 family protein [Syntrophorhabdaceae bacterium]MDD4194840.1 Yip1 family protein [Syntrophorhabdaceae bacterium]HOC46338.1 Yip1 family protein [Syntrophorhabdaceae bacterium]
MNLVERVKNIMLRPSQTWAVVKDEETTIRELFVSYAAILAIIPAASAFIGMSLIGTSMMGIHFRIPFVSGLVHMILSYILSLVGVYVVAFIIDALAPSFNSRKDILSAAKVAVFSFTPAWVAGIFMIIPMLGILTVLASLYGLYILYVGLPVLMDTPREKTLGYFVVIIIVSIVVSIIINVLARLALPSGPMMMP